MPVLMAIEDILARIEPIFHDSMEDVPSPVVGNSAAMNLYDDIENYDANSRGSNYLSIIV